MALSPVWDTRIGPAWMLPAVFLSGGADYPKSSRGMPVAISAATQRGMGGFTLIEMVIVMVLAGVILAIAIPQVGRAYRQRLPHLAADEFVTAYMVARSAAVRLGRTTLLHIDASDAVVWVESEVGAARDTVGSVRRIADAPVQVSSDRSLLCFDGRGLPTTRVLKGGLRCQAPDATVVFSTSGNADTLRTTALGKVLR